MKKRDDIEELDEEIIDDEVVDEDEVIDDEIDELDDKPAKAAPKRPNRAQKPVKKAGMSKKTKIAIISSSAVVGVVAIALVALFVVLPLAGIDVFNKKTSTEKFVTEPMYYDETSSVGLYFYGNNHNRVAADDSTTVDMKRASTSLSTSYFDPSKPTVIWFHGWEIDAPGSPNDRYLMAGNDTRIEFPGYDCSYVVEMKAKGYNVATFQFQNVNDGDKNYANDLASIFYYAVEDFNKTGKSLAFMFASEVVTIFGENYAKDITFVGHSCGGFVCTTTNYLLQGMYNSGMFTNKNLIAKRMMLADPYVNTLGDKMPTKLMGTTETLGDRSKCDFVQDMICSLHENSNVAIDVYFGMSGASKSFVKNAEKLAKVQQHCVLVDMTSIKKSLSNSFRAHVVTRDWVLASITANKLEDQSGDLAPSGACTNDEILGLVGNIYEQQYKGFNLALDSMKKVSDASGFKW